MQVNELAQEVLGHIRQVAGGEALATALNEARQSITSARAERRRQQKVKVSFISLLKWLGGRQRRREWS